MSAREYGSSVTMSRADDPEGHAFGDVFLGVPHQLRHDEQEREDDQAERERPGHLPEDVAVEDAHQRSVEIRRVYRLDYTSRRGIRRVSRGIYSTSHNMRYVN